MASPDYGVQAFLWWQPEVADRDLQLSKDAGFTWVKQLVSWQDVEGAGKGQYDWTNLDRIVDQAEQHGLKLIVRVSQDPDRPFWAGNPPENAGHFADFLAAMASRYKGRIQAYQVWNEPNLAREWGGRRPDPAGYARLLKIAYSAIKGADPKATVITAGMAPTGTDTEIAMPDIKFYDQMYQAMKGNSDGYFDMLGVHAAGFAAPPEVSPDETAADKPKYGGERFFAFRHVEDVRKIMEKLRRQGQARRHPGIRLDHRQPARFALLLARRGRGHRRAQAGVLPAGRSQMGQGKLAAMDRSDEHDLHAGRQLDQERRAVLLVDHRPRLPGPLSAGALRDRSRTT